MRAGLLRHRVELQSSTMDPNDFGEPVPTWTTYATVWGRVSALRGEERWAAQQLSGKVTHEVEVRWSSDVAGVKSEHRIRHAGRTLRIEGPHVPDERGVNIILPCSEEVE